MDDLILKLKDFGCDVESAINRCVNDEELYIMLVKAFVDDDNFAKLRNNIECGNIRAAFDNAHTIKGVAANLELLPIYNVVVIIVEKLRSGDLTGISDDIDKLSMTFARYQEIVRRF